ncbi:hypothetical protein GCM10017790_11070 [Amycolatopsis oliviviridis]|uniref:DUF4407 domain-containing protein n=1 Tax=Amycolatopsis oliviviridis TaxID=1471590 RepID=A0ABQ3L671_9PSEU|nr:hypothetical protein GCM10017790_11070 [Amycolatopsis oliviviridis]
MQRSLAASGTRRFDSFGRTIAVACFRTAIAVLIAVAIAQPLMLRLFQPEIENQIQTTRVAQSQAFTSREYNSELFRNARKELDAARLRLDQARMATLCEITGSCGTGQAGQGNLARQRRLEEEQAQTDFDAANSRYQTVLAQIERSSQAVAMRPVGLVEQFEAYSDVSDRNPSVAAAFWVVGALFVTVEMLPVLLIGAARRRGTTLYEKLLAINERYERDKFEFEAALAAGQRLTDESDPEVDDVLRRFEQQRDEIDQNTQATLSSVVQLAEEREIRHRAG